MSTNRGGCCGGAAAEQATHTEPTGEEIKAQVREVYGAAITADDREEQCGCGCSGGGSDGPTAAMEAALSGHRRRRRGPQGAMETGGPQGQ